MQKTWFNQVNTNFNEAALSYNESASIQRSTALKLAKICSQHPIRHGLWVDLGSGTGLLAKSLEELHPNQNVVRLDNSKKMIDQHSEESVTQLWDLNNGLPKWSEKPNLLASSFVLHWLDNPQKKLKEWLNSLSLDGWIALAIPIKGSFPEWYEAAEKASLTCTALDLPSYDSLIRVVPKQRILYNKIEVIKQTAKKATSLLKPMIKVGAQSSQKEQLSVSDWRHVLSFWPISNKDHQVSLSWSIQFLLIKR
jgi:malonyl-CoA O-methyltransferase